MTPVAKPRDEKTEGEITTSSSVAVLKVPRKAALLVAIWAVSVLAALTSSHFGRNAIMTMSGDWAAQMYLVETDYHNSGLSSNSPARLVDEGIAGGRGANYPHLSHYLVAYTAYLLDLNPLRSMQVWAITALITGCFLMAVRLAFVADGNPSVTRILIPALWLAACSYVGFGLRGHIERNFFFAQFFGTVLAIVGMTGLQRMRSTGFPVLLGIMFWGGLVLPNTHLVPAVWFTLAAIIWLFLQERSIRSAVVKCGGVALATAFLATGGATRAMLQVADHNGWFLTRFGQLSDHGMYLAVGLTVVLLAPACALVSLLLTRRWQTTRNMLVPYAGLISASVLVALQGIAYLALHRGSIYAITKFTYLLALEMSFLVASVRHPLMDNVGSFLRLHPSSASIGCVILFFAAQGPFIATPYDQSLLMKVREKLLDLGITYDPQHRVYPQFSAFDYDRNFYLAIAVMRIPRDVRTSRWVLGGAQGEEALRWPSGPPSGRPSLGEDSSMSVAPSKYYQYAVHLTPVEGKQLAPLTFQMRRPDILTVDINASYQERFKLATIIPAPKGSVLLGYTAFDKSSKPIEQGRSVLVRKKDTWHTEIRLSGMSSSLGSIEFGPVQEWITWFYWQQQPNISRLIFLD